MKKLVFSVIVILQTINVHAQDYFQQRVHYDIKVRLDDINNCLHGQLELWYVNQSPNQLDTLWFHLWPNAYKNRETAYARQKVEANDFTFYYADEGERGYIDSLDFKINNVGVDWRYHPDHIDICYLLPKEALAPDDSLLVSTPFMVRLPKVFSRMGYSDQTYHISQWYPKPAVYDRDAWHPMPYLDMGEFYSEFGTFDVHITIPENYVVAATGQLQDSSEIDWLLEKAAQPVATIEEEIVSSAPKNKTIHYHADNVHDFAWFADKQFNVRHDTVLLPESGRTVHTWLFFRPAAHKKWAKAMPYLKQAITSYSTWCGEYPYQNCSVVRGELEAGGGMEYPHITVIGSTGSDAMLEEVIIHEIGHNWYYGILGFNERDYPLLDEGLTTSIELRYMNHYHPELTFGEWMGMPAFVNSLFELDRLPSSTTMSMMYRFSANINKDQPACLTSAAYTTANYGSIIYAKMGYGYNMLRYLLGDSLHDAAMNNFYEQWQFKHPGLEDLQRAFSNSPHSTGWFFEDYIYSTKKADYCLKRLRDTVVLVSNRRELASPLSLSLVDAKGKVISTDWHQGFTGKQWLNIPDQSYHHLQIDAHDQALDYKLHNNYMRSRGIFKKIEPPALHFLGGFDRPDRTDYYWMPAIGWNYYNGLMLGLLTYNNLFPFKQLEAQIMPMYAFKNQQLAGSARINAYLYPERVLQSIRLSLSATRYGTPTDSVACERLMGELDLTINNRCARARWEHHLIGRYTELWYRKLYDEEPVNKLYELEYHMKDSRKLHPVNFRAGIQLSGEYYDNAFIKSWGELTTRINYLSEKEGLTIRLFGGGFIAGETTMSHLSEDILWPGQFMRMSGATGMQDARHEHVFLARYQSPITNPNYLGSRQFIPVDGGFASYTPFGMTSYWLVAANLRATVIPGTRLLEVFFNAGTYYNAANSIIHNLATPETNDTIRGESLMWEAGLRLNLIPEICSFYFPLLVSNDIRQYNEVYDNYWMRVRFTLNLNQFDFFEKTHNLMF